MDSNNLNDISKIYLEQVSMQLDEKKKEKPKFWWDDDGNGIGYEEGEVSGRFKKKKIKEALIGGQTKIDVAAPYGKLTSSDFKELRKGKRKKQVKEGFSDWRKDLIEVADKIPSKDQDQKIVEKEINNKIDINPKLNLGERVDQLGGTLLEISEIEDFEGVFDDLSESEIFLLSDQLIEEVVEEFFYECLEEGYDLGEVENTLLESLEISSAVLNEERVTYGHDTDVKSNRLEKVKTAVKNTGKKLVRGAGYLGGLAVRGAKAVGRELGAGYKRGRHGTSGSSSESSSGSGSSGSSSSSSGSSSGSGSSRPGLLGRIGSKLMRGLAKAAKSVSRRSRNFARRLEQGSSSNSGSSSPTTQSATSQRQRPRVTQGRGVETPSSVHSKSGVRTANPRSGIGSGKRVEVAGERKKEQPVQRVSVRDVTSPKAPKAPVGTSENPRVGQPASEKSKPEPTVRTRTRTVSTRGFGSFKPSPSGEEAYKKEKERQKTAKKAPKAQSKSKPKAQSKPKPKAQSKPADDQDDTGGKLDDLLQSMKKENYQLSEKAESEQQQKIFGLALSVKIGKTPRSKVSAEVLKIVDSMSEKKIRDFAKTSHEGIPKKVQTKEDAIKEQLLSRMIEKIDEQAIEIAPKVQNPKEKPQNSSAINQVLQAKAKADTAERDLANKQRIANQKGVNLSSISP